MRLVILDRDGTINEDSAEFVKSPSEWQPLPGALEAIARLNHAGWHVVVATNQSGLGRGLFDVASLNAMHAKMHSMLAAVGGRIDGIFIAPMGQTKAATAASLSRGYTSKLPSAMALSWMMYLRWVILSAIWWPPSTQVASRIWCSPARPQPIGTSPCLTATHSKPWCTQTWPPLPTT